MSVEMSWALNRLTGARVGIDSPGPTGLQCGCTCAGPCGEPVVAVNRGKSPGGYKRTPHFRHRPGAIGCEGPTPHDLAVVIADERLNHDIAEGLPAMAEYDCGCRDRHMVNVLQLNGQAVRSVREKLLRDYVPTTRLIQPDIMLLAKQDGGVSTVEVVYSHQPEEYVLAEGYPVLVVPIATEQDARALSDGVIRAGRLYNHPCPDPVCQVCGRRESAGCTLCSDCGYHGWNHPCPASAKQIPTVEETYVLLHHPDQCEQLLDKMRNECSCTMLVRTTNGSLEWNALSPEEKLNHETWRSILPSPESFSA